MTILADSLTLDAPRRTSDGYLVARAKAARAGIYQYLGREVDPTGARFAADAVVNVFRPAAEVFDQASVASFLMKPVTNDHPAQAVTADNWRQHAKGVVGKALRDGDHLSFDLVLMDAATIADVESGKRELSNGYACELDFTAGTHDGQTYDAVQRTIRGNHVAVVARGRAGSTCRIGDSATCDAIQSDEVKGLVERTYNADPANDKTTLERSDASKPNSGVKALTDGELTMKIIIVDGLQVEVTDAAEAAIKKLQGQLSDAASAQSGAETALATANTAIAAKDAEIVTLTQAVADAKVTPAQLRDAAKAHALVCDKAKALGVTFAEDADADAIMRAVVDAKMGDAAKAYNADQISAAFAVLTKDAKPATPLADGIRDATPQSLVDEASAARAQMIADLKGEKPATAA